MGEQNPALANSPWSAPSGQGFDRPSGFERELDRARRHLARLEAEQRQRERQSPADLPPLFAEDLRLATICNLIIWAIMLLPVVAGVVALVLRLVE